MIAARQIAFGGSKRNSLPDGVIPIEYLVSDGNAYIDTGRPIGSDFGLEAVVKIISDDAQYKSILGARNGGNDYQFTFYNGYLLARYGTTNDQYYQKYPVTDLLKIKCSAGGKLYLNGDFVATLRYGRPSSYNIYLFGSNNAGSLIYNLGSGIQVYSIKLSNSNGSFDLVPVRVGDVGYMFDRVSGQLFGNAGTGAFVLGSDL
jgi:hypothetical protein